MRHVRAGEYTFVTNNRTDFLALYGKEELHAGLIVLIPNVTPQKQRELFRAALAHIGGRELANVVVEAEFLGSAVRCREYEYPVS